MTVRVATTGAVYKTRCLVEVSTKVIYAREFLENINKREFHEYTYYRDKNKIRRSRLMKKFLSFFNSKNSPAPEVLEEEERCHHYIAEDSWFEVDFPSVVRKEEEKQEDPESGWSKTISYTAGLGDSFYSIMHYSFESAHVDERDPRYNMKAVLEDTLKALVRDCAGSRLVNSGFTSFLGHQALDAELRSDTTIYKITFFFNGRDSYLISITYPLRAPAKPTFEEFKSSFKFREKILSKFHFVCEEAGFEVDFPEEPKKTEKHEEGITASGVVIFYEAIRDQATFSVVYNSFDDEKAVAYDLAYNMEARLVGLVTGMLSQYQDSELLSAEYISFLGYPAVNFAIKFSVTVGAEKFFYISRITNFFKDLHAYTLTVTYPVDTPEPNFAEFTASFVFRKKSL